MFNSKKKTSEGKFKTIEQPTRRRFDNELNRMTELGWEPMRETFKVTPVGGLSRKTVYTIILKKKLE
jgi:hypothetical protein